MKLIDKILDLLYPPRCAFCHKVLENNTLICRQCRSALPYTHGMEQQKKITSTVTCFAPLFYEKTVRDSILRYKFHGVTAYAGIYGEFLSKCIDENDISCDIITWVPLSKKRLRGRGYDQARLLAEETARRQDLPCVKLLVKRRNTAAQSLTGDAVKRKANIAGAYLAVDNAAAKDKSILLIDDIVTTGATLGECIRTLEAAGYKKITCLALVRKRE